MEGQYLNLSFSWLLILPLIAGVLVFQGAWLDDGISARGRPKKYQRRLKAKILIHRALIINLLLATFFVFTSSFTVLPDIVQGLLLTAVMTLPVLIYLLFIVFKWPFKKKLPAGDSVARPELASSIIQSPSYKDLNEMIVSLQKKELKLEKLVITQKAVIDIERQKNQKAQLLTRNAMTLMSKAKEGARVAIRVAQQERKERLRLEASNINGAMQLENGPSPTHFKNTVKN